MNFLEEFINALENFYNIDTSGTESNKEDKYFNYKYMTIINFDEMIGKEYKTITNNKYCLSHPSNTLIVGKTNSGKTNILFNLIAKNSIYEKTFIYTNNIYDKYSWLKNRLKMMCIFL